MLIYTAIIIISVLVGVPIIILIYETISLGNKATSDFNFDERIAATVSASGLKYHVRPVNVDYAKSTIRRKQDTVTPIRAEKLASVDRLCKIVTKEAPENVNDESVCEPINVKVSANT